MLIVEIFQVLIKNVLRGDYRIVPINILEKFRRFLNKNLPDEEKKSVKNLIENKDLVVEKADKGNTIVILNKNDYILRLNRILEDTLNLKGSMLRKAKPYII